MRWVQLILLMGFLGLINRANAQALPHPEFRVKYYIRQSEHVKNTVAMPSSVAKVKPLQNFVFVGSEKVLADPNYQEKPLDSSYLLTSDFPVFSQYKGFDTIMDITKEVWTRPFYIHKTEVSNKQYREFLADSGSIEFKELGMPYAVLLPDTQVWISAEVYNSAYMDYYFRHPAFDHYPVVGVSAQQAKLYCLWLQRKLTKQLGSKMPHGYRIECDLPSSAEWCATYDRCIQKPSYSALTQIFKKQSIGSVNHYSLLALQGGKNNYIINTYGLTTNRGVKLYHFNGNPKWIDEGMGILEPTTAGGFPSKDWPELYHFLGNVAEWTSSPAMGHLFNNKTWVYNVSGTLVPNAYQLPSVFDLSSYLHKEQDLNDYYLIKGGSFQQDYYYTEPFAAEFKHKNKSFAHVGFRPVLRFYKN